MTYSLFVIVCLIIHFVINIDIFRKKSSKSIPAMRAYRVFVVSIALYFIVDLLWGIFEENKLPVALYIDTTIYFVLMGFTILAWTRYVVKYLDGNKWANRVLLFVGNGFFLAEIILLIINIFAPVLFRVDAETCVYTTYKARNIMLYVQILFYFILINYSIVFSIIFSIRSKKSYGRKYLAISLYSSIMMTAIIVQIYNPYLPLYSIGCIVGSALLSSFLINDIKEEYKEELEHSKMIIEENKAQLSETIAIAYTDPLTNIKNKHAYVEEEDRIDKLIAINKMEDFAVVVFDLNGLKSINDTRGHDAGDVYIVDACRTIEKYFGNEGLYRFGGDEFVAILTGEPFKNRNKLMSEFEKYIDECLDTDLPIIASGMSRYRKGTDNTYHAVFYRADKIMYSRKDILKEHHS